LRKSEEKFRALFEGTSQPAVLHDADGIMEANPSWLKYMGYSSVEEVKGKHPAEISAPIQPGGESAEALEKRYITNALTTGSARFEWIVLRRDGAEMQIEVFLTPIQLGSRQLFQAVAMTSQCANAPKRNCARAKPGCARVRHASARPFAPALC
jgi:PAS domain S-box-containing protein